jgi:hypothetical protein
VTCQSCQMSRPDASQIRRARAIMCSTCIYGERSDAGYWGLAVVGCTVSGMSIEAHMTSCQPSCPKGLHPDKDGIVKWLGVRWFGVPMPKRFIIRKKLTGPVPGCGCIRVLKLACGRIGESTLGRCVYRAVAPWRPRRKVFPKR